MTTVSTNELTGPALDWAVAKCAGMVIEIRPAGACGRPLYVLAAEQGYTPWVWKPSTDWSEAGLIIEREEIGIRRNAPCSKDREWEAMPSITAKGAGGKWGYGPTPLIAAMRCYVASKLGATVEVPNELQP